MRPMASQQSHEGSNRANAARVVFEIATVLLAFLIIGRLLRQAGFTEWQRSVLGGSFLSNGLLFLGLPALASGLGGRNPAACGLTLRELGYHFRAGGLVGGVLLPATMLFAVVGVLELDPKRPTGATILSAGFAAAGVLAIWLLARRATPKREASASSTLFAYLGLLAGGAVLGALLQQAAPLVTRLIYVILFVALLEEYFFRGYVQTRLNDAFERRLSLLGIRFGPGLAVSALLFGLFHPVMSGEGGDWAWALWTGVVGLVFGLVREKTGAVVASAVAHGLILLPMVAFGG